MSGDQADVDALVLDVSREIVAETSPEELELFEITAPSYVNDPERAIEDQAKDEPLGFGVTDAAILVTPYVLAAVKAVVKLLATELKKAAREEGQSFVHRLIRKMFHASDGEKDESVPQLVPRQLDEVRSEAFKKLTSLGMPNAKATVIADAIVGGLR